MTKGKLIESIIIKINGGRLTSDTRVRREDVEVLLASAINYTTTSQFYINRKETGENDIPESFVSTYHNVAVLEDTDRSLRYIDLPTGILTLPKNYGLQSVSPMKGSNIFVQTNFNDRQQNEYYSNSFADISLYWLEGEKVYFQNLPQITDKVLVRLIQSLKDIADDQELPIAAGLEVEVLKIMEAWFNGTKQIPEDLKPNNANPNQ